MSQKIVRKNYSPNGGVDLKSNDIIRDTNYLTGGANMRYGNNFGFRKRYGFHKKISEDSNNGPLYEYKYIDRFGDAKTEIISFTGMPSRLIEGFFTLTNNSVSPATMSFYYDETVPAQFRFILDHIGGTEIVDCGAGVTGDPKITDLRAALHAVTGFTAIINSTDNAAQVYSFAACSEILSDEILPAGKTRQIKFHWWEPLNATASPAATVLMNNEPGTDNLSQNKPVTLHDVMYVPIAPITKDESLTTEKRLCKYDGLTYYRAGLPSAPMVIPGGPLNSKDVGDTVKDCRGQYVLGANPTSKHGSYRLQLKCRDNAGNVITGRISVQSRGNGSAENRHVGLYVVFDDKGVPQVYKDNPLQYGHKYRDCAIKDQGFYDHCGFSEGATSSLTVPMSALLPHSIKKNDVVRFYDIIQEKFMSSYSILNMV